jgi:hypothetical protein
MTMRAAVPFRAASELEATRPKPTGPHCAWSQRNSPRCCPEGTVREHCRFLVHRVRLAISTRLRLAY